MVRVVRELGTDYLFAGLLEKELKKHDFPLDVALHIEPSNRSEIFFSQDVRITDPMNDIKFCFYVEPTQEEEMTRLFGKNCALVTYAADPELHYQHDVEKIYDVGFIGNKGGDDRDTYLDVLRESGLKFYESSATNGDFVASELSRCKVLFNYIRYVDVNLRFFETMAIGCQLVNRKPGLEKLATRGLHYRSYNSPKEMLAVLDILLNNEGERKHIETNARSHFLSNHTYAHRATAIINHLKEFYGVYSR